MKIKHFAGYGTVNAKKISKTQKNGKTKLVVEVTGNHEYGLQRDDPYTLKLWLINRFDKSAININPYRMQYSYTCDISKELFTGIDNCTYTFEYDTSGNDY